MSLETRFGPSQLDSLSDSLADPADKLRARARRIAPLSEIQVSRDLEVFYVFETCQVGVVLRAVIWVELVLAVGAMFDSNSFGAWLRMLALATGGALPATLIWLLCACAMKKRLQRLRWKAQLFAGSALGAAAGVYACGMLYFIGLSGSFADSAWLSSSALGALLALILVAALIWRAQRRQPASDAARLAELQSRIRPHFLFNTLNSAIALVRESPAQAENMLEDLGELFRSALVDRGPSATLGHEIELAQRYLAIEEVRFGKRLRVSWAIGEGTGQALLPPLALQPLVENAVKHGVEPSASGADLKISSERRAGMVVLKITNTAPGGQGHAGHGVALKNVQERLRLLHDVQASFRCTWVNGVYQVRMEFPA